MNADTLKDLLWWKRARLQPTSRSSTGVKDGDTIEVFVDDGDRRFARQTIRLLGIDTPETRTKDLYEKALGKKAKLFTMNWLVIHEHGEDWPIYFKQMKRGKYGRLLANVFCCQGHSLNVALVEAGHVKKKKGKKGKKGKK